MRLAIGVDVGGTSVKAARVDEGGAVRAGASLPTASAPAAVLAQIDALIAELDADGVVAVGVGVPGRVDVESGQALSGGFVDLSGPPIAQSLARVGSRPFAVDNDASMALIGECRAGAARDRRDVVLLTLGTGVGGAALVRGQVLRGRGAAGQFGHVAVEFRGALCKCGRLGCLETTSSGSALAALMRSAGLAPATRLEDLLARDDALAVGVVARWARPLRAGVDSLAAALDPELVLIGGALGVAAVAAMARFPAGSPWFRYDVAVAALGERAGVIGAALAALDAAR